MRRYREGKWDYVSGLRIVMLPGVPGCTRQRDGLGTTTGQTWWKNGDREPNEVRSESPGEQERGCIPEEGWHQETNPIRETNLKRRDSIDIFDWRHEKNS